MDSSLQRLRTTLEDALDDLSSPRTASGAKTQALRSLEKTLATACVRKSSTDVLDHFIALQYTFECNVPSRILGWIASATAILENLTSKGIAEPDASPEITTLSSQLALGLSIIQGVCLIHPSTKTYLGRKYALEVLLDLFLSSRHLSSTPFASSADVSASPVKPTVGAPPPLASAILDTLLCILVDASPALRVFEACNGVHAVVKILKRAGTPREVRMKCLEFLYFYLLDETTPSTPLIATAPSTPAPTAPSTPMQPAKKSFLSGNGTPARPVSRYGSSTFSLTSSSFASTSTSTSSASSASSSSRSTSGSSTSSASSFSSTSSNAGSTSPRKQAQVLPGTPQPRPKPTLQTKGEPLPRALLMLRRELDFVPLSPKRASVVGENGVPLGRARGVARTRSKLVSDEEEEEAESCDAGMDGGRGEQQVDMEGKGREREARRTTEDKKRLLGTMLGNVEALVEGVRKAGIWGLG
ncbi:cell division control protein 14, SIN component-domain-containing protein [Mycena galericulata]|nr:cell division control protein 14, SIN component-domain-containing protein [Mycena galericulata]